MKSGHLGEQSCYCSSAFLLKKMGGNIMGGRGSSSGKGSGGLKMITVNAGGTHLTYREHGGKTYSIGVGNSPQGAGKQ